MSSYPGENNSFSRKLSSNLRPVQTHATVTAPNQYKCPITLELLRDPVTASDGHTYERSAIVKWFLTSSKSPMTGLQLESSRLVNNLALKSSIEDWCQANQVELPQPEPINLPPSARSRRRYTPFATPDNTPTSNSPSENNTSITEFWLRGFVRFLRWVWTCQIAVLLLRHAYIILSDTQHLHANIALEYSRTYISTISSDLIYCTALIIIMFLNSFGVLKELSTIIMLNSVLILQAFFWKKSSSVELRNSLWELFSLVRFGWELIQIIIHCKFHGFGQFEEEAIWVYVEHFQYAVYYWTAQICGLSRIVEQQMSLGVVMISGSICVLHLLGWRLRMLGILIMLFFVSYISFIDVSRVGKYVMGIVYEILSQFQ